MSKKTKTAIEILQQNLNFAAERKNKAQLLSYLEERGIDLDENLIIEDLFGKTIFGSKHRTLPNDFARSCLFTARNHRVPRKLFNREKLFHISEQVEILYTGTELRSIDDELIWMQLVDYCRSSPLGNYVEFDIRQLIKDIGWETSGAYYKKIRESLSRMKATEIYIKNSKAYGISGGISLLENYIGIDNLKGEPTKYKISIDKNLIILFAGNTFSNIPWSQYKQLSPMARRLADYIFSHKYPNPIAIPTFLAMCGSDQINSPVKTQNQNAKKICEELISISLVKAAFVTDGKIVIER